MKTYLVDLNNKLDVVYYNGGKSNIFKVRVDVTLCGLKDQLDQFNQRHENVVHQPTQMEASSSPR